MRKNHPAAQVTKHRGARKIKGDYYGPFASAGAVNRTLDTLQRAFKLRNCSDSYYEARTRPCLQFQIKRCAAPCTGEISLDDYGGLIGDAEDFLQGKSDKLRKRLQGQMDVASKAMQFEKAAEYRDRLRAMAEVSTKSGAANVNPKPLPMLMSLGFIMRVGKAVFKSSFSGPARIGGPMPIFRGIQMMTQLNRFLAPFSHSFIRISRSQNRFYCHMT